MGLVDKPLFFRCTASTSVLNRFLHSAYKTDRKHSNSKQGSLSWPVRSGVPVTSTEMGDRTSDPGGVKMARESGTPTTMTQTSQRELGKENRRRRTTQLKPGPFTDASVVLSRKPCPPGSYHPPDPDWGWHAKSIGEILHG